MNDQYETASTTSSTASTKELSAAAKAKAEQKAAAAAEKAAQKAAEKAIKDAEKALEKEAKKAAAAAEREAKKAAAAVEKEAQKALEKASKEAEKAAAKAAKDAEKAAQPKRPVGRPKKSSTSSTASETGAPTLTMEAPPAPAPVADPTGRISQLESEVAELRTYVAALSATHANALSLLDTIRKLVNSA